MSVFISHRHTDTNKALEIDSRLKSSGIHTYIDVLDPQSQTTNKITDVITNNINACTHIIAVVSETTAQSWWVPFEVGEATIINRRISSFQTSVAQLPDYLTKWPIMKSISDVDFFIQEYNKEKSLTRDMRTIDESFESASTRRTNADYFHNNLKHRISRGY